MRIRFKFAALALTVAAASIGVPAHANDALHVRLDWTPWGDHAAFHLAAKKGLYTSHGLDVTFDDGNGSVAAVQIVGNGGSYDIGHAALAVMAIARAKGLPVKAVANFFRQNDIGLMVGKDSGIEGPKDLRGKNLTFTAGSLETPFLDRFLAAGGLTRGDVGLTNVDAASKGGMYMSGKVDGAFSSAPFMQPIFDKQRPTKTIRFSDYGLQFPSFGLFATENSLSQKGDAIKRFASITAGCWEYIFNGHEDEAVQAIMEARPQAKLDPKVLREQIASLHDFVSTPATKDLPFGFMTDEDWKQALDTLKAGGLVDHVDPPGALYTNNYLDPKLIKEIADGGK
ncbi:MAG: ABC transporter substrate-binding protein [Methylobacteriaceae bacterium]|nr:ABC transporter substrate-binding protein [Methylobacteriaceae bacterium]